MLYCLCKIVFYRIIFYGAGINAHFATIYVYILFSYSIPNSIPIFGFYVCWRAHVHFYIPRVSEQTSLEMNLSRMCDSDCTCSLDSFAASCLGQRKKALVDCLKRVWFLKKKRKQLRWKKYQTENCKNSVHTETCMPFFPQLFVYTRREKTMEKSFPIAPNGYTLSV